MRILVRALPIAVMLVACKGKPAKRRDAGAVRPPDAAIAVAFVDAATTPDAPAKAARLEHTVWNLVDNRHTAHRAVDNELVLDARTVSFARYTRFGLPESTWHLGAQAGGERVALADKLATLEVPSIPEQKPPTQITARVHAGDKQTLELRVNGRKAGKTSRIPLEAGWQTIAFPVEAGAIVPGENILALQTLGPPKSKQKVALSWLRVGASHPPADQDPLAAAIFDATADAIDLVDHASLTWYAVLPEGAHLVAEVAAPCLVEVGARAGDAAFAGGLLAADQERVDLSALAGKAVRLSLTTRDCPKAHLTHARITVHGPAVQPLPTGEPPRYVLLWKLSELRLDGFEELSRAATLFRSFAWFDKLDRAALGKAIATSAKIQATLIDDATTDAVVARFDRSRDKPGFWFADTTQEPGGPHLDRVIAQLKSWGIWEQTMLLVADDRAIAIHDAARFPGGTSVDEGAEAVDLVPTILDALGQSPDPAARGSSVVPLAQGIGRGWPRPSHIATGNDAIMKLGGWTMQISNTDVKVFKDTVDVTGGPIERRMLTDSLGLLLPLRLQWKKSDWGVASNLTPAGAHALDEASP